MTDTPTPPAPAGAAREAALLATAAQFSFRARMDKKTNEGPVFERGAGSVVFDVTGKEYLDFNSGQMCSALGHNHPTITAAIKDACDTMIHAHSSHYNVKEIELASRLGAIMPRPLQKSLFGESGADANEMAMMIARWSKLRFFIALALLLLFRVNAGDCRARDLQNCFIRAANQKTRLTHRGDHANNAAGGNDFITSF